MGGITHSKVNAVPDGADSSVVRPSDWNADHVVTITAADVGAVPGPQVVFVQPSDPGTVGAGALWVDTTTPGTSDQHVWKRDAADASWVDLLELYVSSGDVSLTALTSGGGGAAVSLSQGGGSGVTSTGGNILAGAGSGNSGGNVTFSAGNGGAIADGGVGGDVSLSAGSDDDGDAGAALVLHGGSGTGDGRVKLTTGNSSGSAGHLLTAQGDTTALWGSVIAALIASGHQAAFVEPTTATPEAIANSLIACGLMAAA